MMRMAPMDITFDPIVPTTERLELFTAFTLAVVARNDRKRTYTVEVPDGTQWEWANRLMKVPGVRTVTYTRPRTIADN